jgi:hypothetical protein
VQQQPRTRLLLLTVRVCSSVACLFGTKLHGKYVGPVECECMHVVAGTHLLCPC